MRELFLHSLLLFGWIAGANAEDGKKLPPMSKPLVPLPPPPIEDSKKPLQPPDRPRAGDGKKLSPFEVMADSVCRGVATDYIRYWYVAPVSAWGNAKATGMLGLPPIEDFSKKLLQALDRPGTEDHETALSFVQNYATLARACASQHEMRDLEALTHRTFAPYSKEIKAALAKALDAQEFTIRYTAASALLAFEPENASANSIVAEQMKVKEKESRESTCRLIRDMHLSNRQAVAMLILGLGDKDEEVRGMAANAVWGIGPDAKAAVPALIKLLESGEKAYGGGLNFTLQLPFWPSPRFANLALLALSAIGPDAKPAVPQLVRMFPKAKAAEQCEILECLAKIGPAATESSATIEKAMQSEETSVRLSAACALLCLAPDDQAAAALLNQSLKDSNKRRTALRICVDIEPRAKALVTTLTDLLEDEDTQIRELAAKALGHIGPAGASASPALGRLLIQERDHDNDSFTIEVARACALAHMGKAAVPFLIRATAPEARGRPEAIEALGNLGPDTQTEAVLCLIGILGNKKDPLRFEAAIALGRLGERARRARPALKKYLNDPGMGLVA